MDSARTLSGRPLLVIICALLLSLALIALDQTIVATALPAIVSDFDALQQATWIVSGYLLAIVAFTPMYGQLLTILPTKWVYTVSVSIFELGSLFCAIASSYFFLVLGRVISGVGAAGICVSILTIIAECTEIRHRPIIFGAIGTLYNVSSIVGPIIGGMLPGAFTTHVSWRWCFYINLPLGALSLLVIIFRLPLHQPLVGSKNAIQALMAVDWIGCFLCLATLVLFVLPLLWGSNGEWSSPVVISLFCVFALLLACSVIWARYKGDKGILPLNVVAKRSQIGGCIAVFFSMFNLMVLTYYIPLFYQAVYDHSAIHSGIDMLPFLLSCVITTTGSAVFLSRTGHFWYLMVVGPAFCCVGGGFLYTMSEHTPSFKSIIYQILYGIGVGSTSQNAFVTLQAYSDPDVVALCNAIATFMQILGGFIGVTVAGVVFDSQLRHSLGMYAPQVNPGPITESVAAIYTAVSLEDRPGVLRAYVLALDRVFLMAVPAGVLTMIGAALIRNVNLNTIHNPANREDERADVHD